MENRQSDAVEKMRGLRRACPGMGLLLAKQLLIKHNWFLPFAVEDAWMRFRGDWPVADVKD